MNGAPTDAAPQGFAALLAHSRHARDAGDHRNGASLAARALALAERDGSDADVAAARELYALHSLRLHELGTAMREASQALAHFSVRHDLRAQSRVHAMLALAFTSADLPGDAMVHASAALYSARSLADERAELWALTRLGGIYQEMGDDARGEELHAQARVLARRLNFAEELFAALLNGAQFAVTAVRRQGARSTIDPRRLEAATADAHEVLALAQASGNPLRECLAHELLGAVKVLAGDFDRAATHLQSALGLARAGGYRLVVLSVQEIRARLMQAQGRMADALEAFDTILQDPDAPPASAIDARRARYEHFRAAGRLDDALRELEALADQQMRLEKTRSGRQLSLLTARLEAEREQQAAMHERLDAELQRLRAAEVARAQEKLARAPGELERLLAQRTLELEQARSDAESAQNAKATFLANMSHELRTPLAGMLGMTELALKRATDERQIEYLRKSMAAGRQLVDMVNDLLDLAQMENGRFDLYDEEFGLTTLVSSVVAACAADAQRKGIAFDTHVDESVPPRLVGDARRLRQLLLVYASNAIKFSERGTVQLRVGASNDGAAVMLRLDVADQGTGIDAATQARLFVPFAQGDVSLTRRTGGAGLGLAIARRIARRMGGDTQVESTPGRGSVFSATVRLRKVAL